MHGFEQARERTLGVDVGAGRDADRAGAGRAEVGEDVAEQVRHLIASTRLRDAAIGLWLRRVS